MIRSKDFDAIRVENSDTEFVVVARASSGFVPVIVSENCSVDLMGFSASQGHGPIGLRSKERPEFYEVRSDIEEYHQVEVDLGDLNESPAYFCWKGTMPDDMKEFLGICQIGLHQIFLEKDKWKNASQEFFAWHLGQIVHQIEGQNVYRALEKRRRQEKRKRSETFFTMFAVIGTVAAVFVIANFASDFLSTLSSAILN